MANLDDIFCSSAQTNNEIEEKKTVLSADILSGQGSALGQYINHENMDKLFSAGKKLAEIRDSYVRKKRAYESKKEILIKEALDSIQHMKNEVDSLQNKYDTLQEELIELMEEHTTDRIYLNDRDPIRLKLKRGTKKPITRKWLEEEFGKESADNIWAKVPRRPDKKIVVCPAPYDDQPSD